MDEQEEMRLSPNVKKLRELSIDQRHALASRLGITEGHLRRLMKGGSGPRFVIGNPKCLAARMDRMGYPVEGWKK